MIIYVLFVLMKMILTTFPSHKSAIQSVKALTEKKLIACAQIDGPVNSYYWWKGKVQEEQEWRVSLKTNTRNQNQAFDEIIKIHPYENPQWIVLEGKCSETYSEWIKQNLRQ